VTPPAPQHTLICGVNWLGDACMSMSAIQAWKSAHPERKLALLAKPALVPLWQCHRAIDQVLSLPPGNLGTFNAGRNLRQTPFQEAYIFPNSWRAALPPLIGRIPRRIGLAGHTRSWLLTGIIPEAPETEHQQWEYARILGLPLTEPLPLPDLKLPDAPAALSSLSRPIIGILPGAARGPAKRWPAKHFIAAAQSLHQSHDFHFVIMGTPDEAALSREITQALQPYATCIAGQTTLPILAASLQACAGILSNDSGGMHLAAAVGTPVVAMFGRTNPAKTGPIGPYTRCLQPPGIQGTRRIPRNSAEAERILASIPPEQAAQALLNLIQEKNRI